MCELIALEVTQALFKLILVSVERFKKEMIELFYERIVVACRFGQLRARDVTYIDFLSVVLLHSWGWGI